jgi:ribonuclease E
VPRDVAEPPKRHSEPRPEVEEFVAEEITSEEPIDAELVEGDDQAGTPAARHEDEERTGRKRRRRRRGGRRSKSGRSAAEEPPREAHDDDAQLAPLAESASDEEGPSEAGAPTEEPKGRPKRRRRRGSGRNRDKPRARSAEPKAAGDAEAEPGFEDEPFGVDDEPSELAAVASESDAGEFVDSESDAGEDEGADSPTDKNSHRAIPAWEEAIGYIVSVNMENRSKNPKSGPPRGRGRGRGNRGNSRGNNHRRPG